MDTAQIDDTTITFLRAAAEAVEHTALITFLIVAGYCAFMHGSALLFTILRAVLTFARECTVHMLRKFRPLLDELAAWPVSIRAALQSDPAKPTVPLNQPLSVVPEAPSDPAVIEVRDLLSAPDVTAERLSWLDGEISRTSEYLAALRIQQTRLTLRSRLHKASALRAS